MKVKKEFDCIEMKDAIQAEIYRDYANMTSAERWADVRRILATSDDPVAQKWRSLRERKPQPK